MIDRQKLIGQKFGRLVVERFLRVRKHNMYYQCRCSCGTVKSIAKTNLISGRVVSCGCYRAEQSSSRSGAKCPAFRHGRYCEDLKGKVFGRLKVLERAGVSEKWGEPLWRVECECGTVKVVRAKDLLRKRADGTGNTTSCGCKRRERAAEHYTGPRTQPALLPVIRLPWEYEGDEASLAMRYGG